MSSLSCLYSFEDAKTLNSYLKKAERRECLDGEDGLQGSANLETS